MFSTVLTPTLKIGLNNKQWSKSDMQGPIQAPAETEGDLQKKKSLCIKSPESMTSTQLAPTFAFPS